MAQIVESTWIKRVEVVYEVTPVDSDLIVWIGQERPMEGRECHR